MGSKKRGITLAALIVPAAFLLAVMAGCTFDRWAELESGHYVLLHDGSAPSTAATQEIQSLDIDRATDRLVLTLAGGTEIVASFVPRERATWPTGCPTNINSTRMEVLDILEDSLTIGAATFSRPILVRDCPRDPVRIVLRADGEIGGAYTACPHPEPCVYFAPQ